MWIVEFKWQEETSMILQKKSQTRSKTRNISLTILKSWPHHGTNQNGIYKKNYMSWFRNNNRRNKSLYLFQMVNISFQYYKNMKRGKFNVESVKDACILNRTIELSNWKKNFAWLLKSPIKRTRWCAWCYPQSFIWPK